MSADKVTKINVKAEPARDLHGELVAKDNTIERYREDLDELRNQYVQVCETLNHYRTANAKQAATIRELQGRVRSSSLSEWATRTHDRLNLGEKLKQAEQLVTAQREELEEQAALIAKLKKDRKVVPMTGNIFTDAFTGARVNAELRLELNKARMGCKRLREERDEARAELADMRNALRLAGKHGDDATMTIGMLEDKIDKLQDDNRALSESCDRLAAERDEARAELVERRDERTGLSRDHARAAHEARELLIIAGTLARQIDRLQG